jgi:hypothetical protein
MIIHPSAQRANSSYAPIARTHLVAHHLQHGRTTRVSPERDVREEMFRMLSHHAKEIGCPPARSGGWIDHVHSLCGLARTVSVAELLEHLKTETSKWIKRRACDLPDFHWQAGYGAFSVSQSAAPQVIDCVLAATVHESF